MICKNCEHQIKVSDIRCPHCGMDIKTFYLVKAFHGWGLADILILIALLFGVCTFFWVYLFSDESRIYKKTWEVTAQAYEETVGQIKVIGYVKNASTTTQEGDIVLELRCFNDDGKIVWNEYATIQDQIVEYNEELPFAFIVQKPEDLSYFNVRATSVNNSNLSSLI